MTRYSGVMTLLCICVTTGLILIQGDHPGNAKHFKRPELFIYVEEHETVFTDRLYDLFDRILSSVEGNKCTNRQTVPIKYTNQIKKSCL